MNCHKGKGESNPSHFFTERNFKYLKTGWEKLPNCECKLQLFFHKLSLLQPTWTATVINSCAISTLLLHVKQCWQTHHCKFVSLSNSSTHLKGDLSSLKSERGSSTHSSTFSCHYHTTVYHFSELLLSISSSEWFHMKVYSKMILALWGKLVKYYTVPLDGWSFSNVH